MKFFKREQKFSYQGEALNVPTAYLGLWSSNNIKNQNIIKEKEFFFLKFEIFYKNHAPTRHIKYKKRDFVPCTKSIMANKFRSTNLERFIRRIKSPLTR